MWSPVSTPAQARSAMRSQLRVRPSGSATASARRRGAASRCSSAPPSTTNAGSMRSFGRRFPGRHFSIEDVRDLDKERDAEDAIGYETPRPLVAALVGAAAWLVFVGQALVRQSVHEHDDARTFVALGMTRSQLVAAAALRALPVAGAAVLIAVLTSVDRVARVTDRSRGAGGDRSGLACRRRRRGRRGNGDCDRDGGRTVVRRASCERRSRRRISPSRFGCAISALPLPAFAIAGLDLPLAPRRALPLRVAVAERDRGHCLWRRRAGPGRVGPASGRAPEGVRHRMGRRRHRARAIRSSTTANYDDALHAVRAAPDVLAAGGAVFDTEGRVEHRDVPVVAFWSLVGPPQPWSVITSGRAPKNTREVALGPKTMRTLGLAIGDRTEVRQSAEAPAEAADDRRRGTRERWLHRRGGRGCRRRCALVRQRRARRGQT